MFQKLHIMSIISRHIWENTTYIKLFIDSIQIANMDLSRILTCLKLGMTTDRYIYHPKRYLIWYPIFSEYHIMFVMISWHDKYIYHQKNTWYYIQYLVNIALYLQWSVDICNIIWDIDPIHHHDILVDMIHFFQLTF